MLLKSWQQKSKEQKPKQQRTFYGYKRQNHYDYISSSSQVIIRYNIYPIGLAKLQYLRSKVQMILADEDAVTHDNKINPLFRYAVIRVMYFEAISSIKRTNYIQLLVNQFAEGVNKAAEKKIQEMVQEINEEIKCMKYVEGNRLSKLLSYQKKMEEFKLSIKKQMLKEYQVKCNMNARYSQIQNCQFQQKLRKRSLEIDEIFHNIDRLQTLKVSQSYLKYSHFQKRYKGFYDIQLKLERREAKPYYIIRINRLTKQLQPVLQTILKLVQQRQEEVNYRAQSKILVKDIFALVKRFQNSNSIQNQNYYYYLGPETVLYDQIALVPKLSYEPLLLETFGLKNRPMSSENRICFNPSPRGLNYFKSLPQYDKQISIMLDDPQYGNLQIYQNDIHRLSTAQKNQIKEERETLCKKLEEIVVWRMILLSSYLSNSKEYGLCPQTLFSKKQKHLKSSLQKLKKDVTEDCTKLHDYLGFQQNLNIQGKFQFNMSSLSDFLQPQKQNDSVIQKYKDANIRKYFQWRNDLIKQMVRLLVNDCLFKKVYNVKKYIIIYLILAVEIIQEFNYLVCLEDKESKQTREIEGFIKKRYYFKNFLELQIKRLKGDRSHIPYQLTTYNKIIQYGGQSRKSNDAQAKYIKEDQIGKILFQYVKNLHVQLQLFNRLNQILNQIQSKEQLTEEDKKSYIAKCTDIKKMTQRSLGITKTVLSQFLYNQLKLNHRQGPHVIAKDASKQSRQFFSLSTQRLDLVSLIYLNFDENKLIYYDTLILPQFNLQQNDRKIQIPKNFDFLPEAGKLNLIGQLLEIGKLQPKKMMYLVKQGKILNDEIEKGKKQKLSFEINVKMN